MSLRHAAVLLTSLTLALTLVVPSSSPRAQETTPPEDEPVTPAETPPTDLTPGEAHASWLQDRLSIRAGYGAVNVRGSSRGGTIRTETQVEPLELEQIEKLSFASTTEFGYTFDAVYRLGYRWFATADVLVTSGSDEDFTDSRDIGNIDGPGDFVLARFRSEYESDYLEWSVGGGIRAYPFKPRENPRFFVDAMLQYRRAEADYTFTTGEMVANPFNPPAFADPRFDPLGLEDASFDMTFETLQAGVHLGWNLSRKFTLGFLFMPTIFARYDGTADLGSHGIVFEHGQGSVHTDPVFHTPNCDSNDPPGAGTPACAGLVDGDLRNPSLVIEQSSNRGAGLRLDLNLDIRFTEAFSISVGYHRQDFRSVGGDHKKVFGDDGAAGCEADPDDPTGPAVCTDEVGDLGKTALTTQSVFFAGRFTWN